MGKIVSNILITLLVLCFVNLKSIANAFHTNDGLKKTDNLKETEVNFFKTFEKILFNLRQKCIV